MAQVGGPPLWARLDPAIEDRELLPGALWGSFEARPQVELGTCDQRSWDGHNGPATSPSLGSSVRCGLLMTATGVPGVDASVAADAAAAGAGSTAPTIPPTAPSSCQRFTGTGR
ncbi:MAG: hypothetical protein M0Z46_09580 [Actinomycetota bacterium]|nr:hypothetical protein [Actinomycetota bacterium]